MVCVGLICLTSTAIVGGSATTARLIHSPEGGRSGRPLAHFEVEVRRPIPFAPSTMTIGHLVRPQTIAMPF